MKKIKIAQIGVLHAHGIFQLRAVLSLPEIFDFVGVFFDYETEEEIKKGQQNADFVIRSLNELENDFGPIKKLALDELLNYPDLDAVIIDSFEKDLVKYALLAAEKNLHIFMDKPGGESREDFQRLVNLCENNKKVFFTGYMYRQNPAVIKALDMIKKGELGKVLCIEAHMDCDHNYETRKWLGNFKGGMTYFLGCHLIDLIYQIQGKPNRILPLNTSSGLDGLNSIDYGMVMFEYDTGWSFAKTSAAEFGGFGRRQLVIIGTEASIEIKPFEIIADSKGNIFTDMRIVTRKKDGSNGWSAIGDTIHFGPFNRYTPMFEEFAKIINNEKENHYSYEYEKNLFNLIMDCCERTV